MRECLKLNPDHPACFAHYKKVKKLVKQQSDMLEAAQAEQWDECLERWQAALKTEPANAAMRLTLDITACRCQSKVSEAATTSLLVNRLSSIRRVTLPRQ